MKVTKEHIGQMVEVSDYPDFTSNVNSGELYTIIDDEDCYYNYIIKLNIKEDIWEPRCYKYGRIPKPDFKDGDPIIVWVRAQPEEEYRRYFKEFKKDSVVCYENGGTKWSSKNNTVEWYCYRKPTKEELDEKNKP
jgi:hypothetical protein